MILLPAQVSRLFAILDPLTRYANERLGVMDEAQLLAGGQPKSVAQLRPASGSGLDAQAQAQVLEEMWEERTVIDDFIKANPARLSGGQLALLRTWRDAISSVFTAWRFPDGVVRFVGCGYAFDVCGISRDPVSMLSNIPTAVKMTLLPFEGRIVYAEAMMELPIQMGKGMLKVIEDDAKRMLAEKKIVSTEADLLGVMPAIREAMLERESAQLAEELEAEFASEAESGDGWHRGELAGMPYEEREAAVMERLRAHGTQGRDEDLRDILAKRCRRGEPKTELAQLLALDAKERLIAVSKAFGSPVKTSLRKAEVVEAMAALLVQPDSLYRAIHSLDTHEIEPLKALVESGGIMHVEGASLTTLAGLPQPVMGLCYAFHHGDDFSFVVPSEIMVALRGFSWDDALEEAREYDYVVAIAEALTELRGVVPVNDFIDEYLHLSPYGFDVRDAMESLVEAMEVGEASFSLLDDGRCDYLLHYEIADQWLLEQGVDDPYGYGPFLEGKRGRFLDGLLGAQHGKEPRPLEADMLAEPSIFHWKEKSAPAQALREFLDAHVPDDADDYFFADKMMEDILEEAKWGSVMNGFQPYADIMEDNGFIVEESVLRRFITLLMNMVNALPNWANNGWAPNELAERETGKKQFYNEDGSRMKVGRNDPCPCGSGKKYKRCCGR